MGAGKVLQILASVAGISAGQLLLKVAATRMAALPPGDGARHLWALVNLPLVAGVAVLGASTLWWVWVLRTVPLSQAYPFMALCFVLVPLGAMFLLGEPAPGLRQLAATALIVAGVVLAGR